MLGGGTVVVATANVRVTAEQARGRDMNAGDYVELSMNRCGCALDWIRAPLSVMV